MVPTFCSQVLLITFGGSVTTRSNGFMEFVLFAFFVWLIWLLPVIFLGFGLQSFDEFFFFTLFLEFRE